MSAYGGPDCQNYKNSLKNWDSVEQSGLPKKEISKRIVFCQVKVFRVIPLNSLNLFKLFLFLVTSCGNPGTIRRGYFIGSDFSIGSTVEYKCARGYKLHGPAISVCKKHGTWTAQPVCVGMLMS